MSSCRRLSARARSGRKPAAASRPSTGLGTTTDPQAGPAVIPAHPLVGAGQELARDRDVLLVDEPGQGWLVEQHALGSDHVVQRLAELGHGGPLERDVLQATCPL